MRLTIALCVAMFSTAILADEPAKFAADMTTVLADWEGKPLKDAFQQTPEDQACAKCDDLTLGMAVTHAMLLALRGDEGIDGAQRWAWQETVRRVHKDKAAQLTGKEQSVIGDRLIKVYANLPNGSVVIGAAMPLIDPNRKAPELK
jgi:hypothetical protein